METIFILPDISAVGVAIKVEVACLGDVEPSVMLQTGRDKSLHFFLCQLLDTFSWSEWAGCLVTSFFCNPNLWSLSGVQ